MIYFTAQYLSKRYGYYIDTGINFPTRELAEEYVHKAYGKHVPFKITQIIVKDKKI